MIQHFYNQVFLIYLVNLYYSAALYERRRRALVQEKGLYNTEKVDNVINTAIYYGQYKTDVEGFDVLNELEKGV